MSIYGDRMVHVGSNQNKLASMMMKKYQVVLNIHSKSLLALSADSVDNEGKLNYHQTYPLKFSNRLGFQPCAKSLAVN